MGIVKKLITNPIQVLMENPTIFFRKLFAFTFSAISFTILYRLQPII